MTIEHIRSTKSFFNKEQETELSEWDKWFEIGKRRRALEDRITELSQEIERTKNELDLLPRPNKT